MSSEDRKSLENRPLGQTGGRRFQKTFKPIYHLNRQALTLLIDVARASTDEKIWAECRALGCELSGLEASLIEDIAYCPFLLIDACFDKPSLWQPSEVERVKGFQEELPFAPSTLHIRLENLARGTCLLAWHLVQSDSVAARLALGVTGPCGSVIANVSLTDLQEISMRQVRSGLIRPRWYDRPDAWRRLIRAAGNFPSRKYGSVSEHGLQMYLRELIAQDAQ